MQRDMQEAEAGNEDFAPLYTMRERWIRIVSYAVTAVVLVGVMQRWGWPALRHAADTAACWRWHGIDGRVVLAYALFVGLPALLTIMLAAATVPRNVRVLRAGQAPLPGEKVFVRTRIVRGRPARTMALVRLFAPLLPLALTLWGIAAGGRFADTLLAHPAKCAPAQVATATEVDMDIATALSTVDTSPPISSGRHVFVHRFAEQPEITAGTLMAVVEGRHIVLINEGGDSVFPHGVIADGKLVRHASGSWIVAESAEDLDAKDVGHCSEGPDIIDPYRKIYWTC